MAEAMIWYQAFSSWLLAPTNLTPHGFCLLWEPGLIWLHSLSDGAIAVAYFSIPAAMVVYVRRRRDVVYGAIPWLFAAFILLCGTGHLMALATLWVPAYWAEGLVKAATALVSILTATLLWKLMPQLLAMPTPRQLRDVNSALSESEELGRALFEHSPAPMKTQNANGAITGVSESWLELFGYALEEVIGRPLAYFHQPELGGAAETEWCKLLETGTSPELERRLRCKDGTFRDVLLKARVLKRPDGPCVFTVLTDITERRRAEEALRAAEERLRQSQKMEAIGQLTGGIAHDFNNTLAAVAGCLESISARSRTDRPDLFEIAGRGLEAAKRAAGLTAQLLSFARRQRLESRPLDAAAITGDLRELLEHTVGARIAIEIERPDTPVLCLADRNQLESAILNLVLNARDAIAGSGKVTISVAGTRIDQPADGLPPPGDYVRIAVADTGSGMSESVRRRVFEPFFTTKPPGQGTGLGLSQIHGFVHQSGGAATIESALGQGTKVVMLLPAASAAAEFAGATALPAAADCPLGDGEQVLLVDDDHLVRATFRGMIEDLGYNVVEAINADAALPLVANGKLRAVLTDLTMPGTMDGLEFAATVQRLRPGLPILLLTGHLDPFSGREVPPGVQFVQKPFEINHLAQLLRRALAEAGRQPAPATSP